MSPIHYYGTGQNSMNIVYVSPITGDVLSHAVSYKFHVFLFKLMPDRLGDMYESRGLELIPGWSP